jgi:hypothetical protein
MSHRSRNEQILSGLLAYVQEDESDQLSVDKLPFLYRVLHQLSSRWNSLSLQLSVSGQDEIQRNARTTDICLAVSLVEWLQSGQATWRGLVEAVFRPAGGGHQVLARDIARSYKSEHCCVYYCVRPNCVHVMPQGNNVLNTWQPIVMDLITQQWLHLPMVRLQVVDGIAHA